VDPAGTVENAKPAFPTVPWTALTPRRPQFPQGPAARNQQEEGGGDENSVSSGEVNFMVTSTRS
jgi:hypothetical protein